MTVTNHSIDYGYIVMINQNNIRSVGLMPKTRARHHSWVPRLEEKETTSTIQDRKSQYFGDILHEAPVGLMKCSKFLKINAPITISVNLRHHPLDLIRRDRSKEAQDIAQLRQRDLPITVGVDALEDPFNLSHLFIIVGHFFPYGVDLSLFGRFGFVVDLKRENEGWKRLERPF